MRRRLLVGVGAALAMLALVTSPAWACDQDHAAGDWACVYVEHVDTGYCQQNPLPQELPLPPFPTAPPATEAPTAPATPEAPSAPTAPSAPEVPPLPAAV